MSDLIATGIIQSSHGVDGYVKVASYSGEFEHFCSLKTVTLVLGDKRKEKTVDDVRVIHNAVLMRFSDIDSIDSARALSKWEVWIPRDVAAPLDEGELYIADLIGCTVVLNGATAGTVRGVIDSGADPLLEVTLPDGTSRFIPFRNQFFGEVDLENSTIELLTGWSVK